MRDLLSTGLRRIGGRVEVLDQTRLPHEEVWIHADSVETMAGLIERLAIRGAPALGLGAALAVAGLAHAERPIDELRRACVRLRATRPTAVNLSNYLDRIERCLAGGSPHAAIQAEVEAIFDEDVALCDAIARNGLQVVPAGARILTHCNTGSLATAGVGTAIGVITAAHAADPTVSVWVDETRPLLQGGRLTSWELGRAGVPNRLICDSMAAMLMARGQVDLVLVGADRIAANGDFANKIGTYMLAVCAAHHGVPFHVVAPCTTLDPDCPTGSAITIEERAAAEVRGVAGAFGSVQWAPADAPVFNPAFDVTPAGLVTSWILDTGVFDRSQVQAGALSESGR